MKYHLTLQEANTLIDRAFIAGYIDDFIIHELTKRGIYLAYIAETDSLEGYKLKVGENRYLYLEFVDDFVADLHKNLTVIINKRIDLAKRCRSSKNRIKADILVMFQAVLDKNPPKDLKDLKDCISALAIVKAHIIDQQFSESFDAVINDLNNLYKILNMEE